MATPELVAELRLLIDESTQVTYTDEALSSRLDVAALDTRLVAGQIWQEKAARFSGLIDVQEGNSNRKLSQLQSQALKMAASFLSDSVAVTTSAGRPARTRPIERQ